MCPHRELEQDSVAALVAKPPLTGVTKSAAGGVRFESVAVGSKSTYIASFLGQKG